jgi:hypothetical protein
MPTMTLAEVNTAARPTSEVRHRMVLRLLEKDPKSLLLPKLDYGGAFVRAGIEHRIAGLAGLLGNKAIDPRSTSSTFIRSTSGANVARLVGALCCGRPGP